MDRRYIKLALYGSKIECARTDNVFFPISEVCNGTVSLTQDDHDDQSYQFDQYDPHDQQYQDAQGDQDVQIPPSTGAKKGLFQLG